jgi:diguanylate cyclase (GGDEF)-like protein/PAS domain S-box-containing protein
MAMLTFGYSEKEAIGRRVAELIVPERLRERHEVGLVRYLRTGESRIIGRRVELPAVDRGGREFPVEITITVVEGPGGRPHFQAFLHDITERKRAENELRRHVADLDAVTQAIRELGRTTDGEAARQAICEGARVLAGAELAVMFEPDRRSGALRTTARAGAALAERIPSESGAGSGAALTFAERRPLFIADLDMHPHASRGAMRRAGARSALWHPVLRGDAAIGVLAVGWAERVDAPPPRISSLMDLIVAEAAVAIERAELLARLESFARTDELTGLLNRRAWDEALPREIARARREGSALCVAIVDLDHFKTYNDQYGHLAGDRLLKEAASSWRSALRLTDVLARYGGEEFAIALPRCGLEEARALVERLRAAMPHGMTCSAGVAQWDGTERLEHLVERADTALYAAKRAGRDRAFVAGAEA